jgi:sugar transferase EpsL
MRFLEFIVAAVALLFLAPLLFLLALLVRLKMGSPVLFKDQRAGLHGQPFSLYKFRTMTNERDAQGRLLPDEKRLTAFGRFLRKTSLDELPQLWNILKGDIGFVGPRPLLMRYLERYNERQARRHEVRPGITGWAQIHGRNNISWEERFERDVWYVENRSLWLDLKILWKTIGLVFSGRDTAAPGVATMPEFLGNHAAPSKPSPSST